MMMDNPSFSIDCSILLSDPSEVNVPFNSS